MARFVENGEKRYREFIAHVTQEFEEYREEVAQSKLAESSKTNYVTFAEMFVKWLKGDFIPGGSL